MVQNKSTYSDSRLGLNDTDLFSFAGEMKTNGR